MYDGTFVLRIRPEPQQSSSWWLQRDRSPTSMLQYWIFIEYTTYNNTSESLQVWPAGFSCSLHIRHIYIRLQCTLLFTALEENAAPRLAFLHHKVSGPGHDTQREPSRQSPVSTNHVSSEVCRALPLEPYARSIRSVIISKLCALLSYLCFIYTYALIRGTGRGGTRL